MPSCNDSGENEGACQQQPNKLRRSNRKRSKPSTECSVYFKKLGCALESSTSTSSSLTTLPYVVVRELLMYLDVDTLESLSASCSYFDELISGRFLTSIDLPLPQYFISEVATSSRLEKKPLLKLRCKKTEENFWKIFPTEYSTPTSSADYMLQTQLSLLSLDKIRELDLVPGGLSRSEGGVKRINTISKWKNEEFDLRLLHGIELMGSLEHVTRLDILFNDTFTSESYRFLLPSLKELGLTILERQGQGRR